MTDITDQEKNDQDTQEQETALSEDAQGEVSSSVEENAGEIPAEKEISAVELEEEAYEDSKDEDPNVEGFELQRVIEGALFAAGEPLSVSKIQSLFQEDKAPSKEAVTEALEAIQVHCEGRGYSLKEVGNGWRFFVQPDTARWVNRLWDEKPQKYSRALLETLALIAYRQPLTRGDIEEVRGVAVSSHIIKTLTEREWVKVVGHRDVPGRPALYATTRTFLDYFNLKSLDELPNLGELKDIDSLNADLAFEESILAEPKDDTSELASGDAANDADDENAEAQEGAEQTLNAEENGEVAEEETLTNAEEETEILADDLATNEENQELQGESELSEDNKNIEESRLEESDSEDSNLDASNVDENDAEETAEDIATEEENPNG